MSEKMIPGLLNTDVCQSMFFVQTRLTVTRQKRAFVQSVPNIWKEPRNLRSMSATRTTKRNQ